MLFEFRLLAADRFEVGVWTTGFRDGALLNSFTGVVASCASGSPPTNDGNLPSIFFDESKFSVNKSREIFLVVVAGALVADAATAATATTLDGVSVNGEPRSFFGVLHGDGHPFVYLLESRKNKKKKIELKPDTVELKLK